MPDIRVGDLSFVGLLVQEVEHVFDSQWESRASVGGAKHRLKQVIHKLLQCPLVAGGPKHGIHLNSHNSIDNKYSNYKIIVCICVCVCTLVANSLVR